MELTFTEKNGSWEAEFSATGDFALRVTKTSNGDVKLYQRSVDAGDYDFTCRLNKSSQDRVIDRQVVGVVYPMWIMVRCDVKPTAGVVTFNS